MQRLYCINNKPIPGTWNKPHVLAAINEGQVYEGRLTQALRPGGMIVQSWLIPSIGLVGECYNVSRFIPLPDATADEMEEEVKEGIANLETVLV